MMKIQYSEVGGKIRFRFYKRVFDKKGRHAGRAYRVYAVSGFVPDEIIASGENAIRKYSESFVKKEFERQDSEYREFDAKKQNINIEISTDYNGWILRGRILCIKGDLVIKLESPFPGTSLFTYKEGLAAAMMGGKVWDVPAEVFSPEALEYARLKLIEIYKEEQNKPVRRLVDKLNKKA